MTKDLKSLVIIFKVHAKLLGHVKQSLADTELSVNEFTALEALYHKGSLSAQELIDKVLIPNSSMTYVLDSLEKKGLITRVSAEDDRRVRLSSLTDEGTRLFEAIYDVHYRHMRSVFDVLTDEEEFEMQELLKKLGKTEPITETRKQ